MRGPWPSRIALIVGTVVVLVGAIVVIVRSGRAGTTLPPTSGVASDKQYKVPVGGGVTLAAEVITPKGQGPFPLVVMPTSFGSPLDQYHGLAGVLGRDGYEIVTYTQRGFRSSGGTVDFAATDTQRDVGKVIDWALAHAPVDRARIGMFGTSYGAGVSLMAAARDPRIKAVVATSGWADFAGVFAENGATSSYALPLLLGTAQRVGRPAHALTQLRSTLLTHPDAANALLDSMSRTRSADRLVSRLNANHPAIMLASGYADSILPPLSLVSFFDRLTVPKRLQLAPGDHGSPEASGLTGGDNATTATAQKWLDHYLKGTANGIDRQPPVELVDVLTQRAHTYRTWPKATDELSLDRPGRAADAVAGKGHVWTAQLTGGSDTAAASGTSTINSPAAYQPPQITLDAVGSTHAMTWTGVPVNRDEVLAGLPRLSVDVAAASGSATLFAYLYDVDQGGTGSLMSVTPYAVTGASTATRVSFDLSPVGWTVARGHRVALVIDTVDPRWRSVTAPNETVTVSSTAADPATLTLPVQH